MSKESLQIDYKKPQTFTAKYYPTSASKAHINIDKNKSWSRTLFSIHDRYTIHHEKVLKQPTLWVGPL